MRKMERVLSYLKPHVGTITWTMAIKFFAAMMDLLIPFILARIIDYAVPSGSAGSIYLLGGVMLGCAVLSLTFNIYANRVAAVTSGKITRSLRRDLFDKLNRLSMAQMDSVTLSSAISRLTTDTYNINQFLNRTQRMGVRAPILLVGGLIMTTLLDPRLTLVLAVSLPVISLIVYQVTKRSLPLYARQQTILDRMVRVLQENITGIRIIKALSKTPWELERFDGVNNELAETSRKAGSVVATSSPLTGLTLNMGLTMVVLVGALLVNRGVSTPGSIIAFLNYFTIISMATMGITRIFIMSSRGIASARRIEQVLVLENDMPVLPLPPQDTPYHVVFDDVSFSYNQVEDNLKHISFALRPGETLGILGATGSGKTTLTNLLLRLYDPQQGRILVDGQDIRSIAPRTLREQIGTVFQTDFILADTIRENIRFWREIPEERLWQAAENAQAADFIRATELGMDHQVESRGNNLSGGQKQRLLIARALAGKPRLLIMDDASSALDYRTDASLRRALATNYVQTTRIIVAQRVSSIKSAEHIIVLDDGRVIGYGTHDQLMRDCPPYREVADIQLGAEGGLA